MALRWFSRIYTSTCPYHDWTYDFEDNLISVPNEEQQFLNLEKKCLGLKPVRCLPVGTSK